MEEESFHELVEYDCPGERSPELDCCCSQLLAQLMHILYHYGLL